MIRWERWLGNGGDLVLQWTPAHSGVFPNHYADVVAKAFLDRAPSGGGGTLPMRHGSLVQYAVELSDSAVSWTAGDRTLLPLMQTALGRYELRRVLDAAKHDVGELIVKLDGVGGWPWETAWTTVLSATSRDDQGGGTRRRATALGAVMRVRAGQLGLGKLDYEGNAAERAPNAIAEVWRTVGTGNGLGLRVADSIAAMAAAVAVPAGGGGGEFALALDEAARVVANMRRDGSGLPSATEWRRVRAVVSGALPEPPRTVKAATRARMAATAAVAGDAESNEGRDGEQLSAMARAARLVVKAAREGSLALCESARAWQRVHEPTWQGGTVGERDTEDANDGIDDEEGGGVDDGFGDEDDDSGDSGDDGDDDEDGDGDGEQGDDTAAARAWDARTGGRAAGGDGGGGEGDGGGGRDDDSGGSGGDGGGGGGSPRR